MSKNSPVSDFIRKNFLHFNAATLLDASKAYKKHLDDGGKMMITLAGAMSTAELGISLAEMIRQDKVHAITCTGANIEEDIFNLIAHEHYKKIPHYRHLTPDDELELLKQKFSRVTDTCIPEHECMKKVEGILYKHWKNADATNNRKYHYEFIYDCIRNGDFVQHHQIDPKNSWVLAACEKNIPIWTPGWEDSSLGNIFTAAVRNGDIKDVNLVKNGIEQMNFLADWYLENTKTQYVGFFQIGGGIAGDFPICVVPMLRQELQSDVKLWGYFCQISDSTTSYGSYSGAVPNEKITWEKLGIETPRFIIESDATIVAPLMFAYVLGQ
ncbi:MAG TPA: deoxyhypusine synthase family protein [bacterium]|nr:deoxyhypusine synthase family protein [Myxococcales bacterium]OQA61083.1 MAG: deoxyhypusine synthase-like protein [bacterium ADurb.Bin270]HPW44971.1 deoxyhypusine synthase family protein [bacterium]HQC50465.1 deoxyhypusine synthase family protein [bacterium]HQG12752.1 deoxyhypusine synthase family protein [bacterium]